jgi:hypothetical protein
LTLEANLYPAVSLCRKAARLTLHGWPSVYETTMLDVVNVSAISFFWKELKNEITYRILEADIARLGICIRLVSCVCYVGGQDIRRQSSAIPRPGTGPKPKIKLYSCQMQELFRAPERSFRLGLLTRLSFPWLLFI